MSTPILLDLSFPAPAENLSFDEVLLDDCDDGGLPGALRFWEPLTPFVVVGYANSVRREVNLDFCASAGIPVFRRCSGGGTVLQAPGCLNYSLVLRIVETPQLAGIHSTNLFVLGKVARAVGTVLNRTVDLCGQTDLALMGLKIAGNAQRRKKSALLFHGSILLDLDLELVENALLAPSRQPDYRAGRSHRSFLMNLQVNAELIKVALASEWDASVADYTPPREKISTLAREKYETPEWNHRF